MDKNTLFIVSDQFAKHALACYGNENTNTPNITQIANEGVVFSNAICNSPLCCPSRASLATGHYVHKIKNWDNSLPYSGSVKSWMHLLKESSIDIGAIGKLHFRSTEDDNGFSEEINVMHTVEGFGDVAGCLREECGLFDKRKGVIEAGPGQSSYTKYDSENAQLCIDWIENKNKAKTEKPWVLFWGIALPHPPNKIMEKYYNYYKSMDLKLPPLWEEKEWNNHPATNYIRKFFNFEEQVSKSEINNFLAAYYGACSYVDHLIGLVINKLKVSGQYENTRIVFTADHGETMGNRGIFGKFSLYEESIGVPLIIKSSDIPKNTTISTPVSLIDIFPTMCSWYDLDWNENLPGESLETFMHNSDLQENRIVFSEYHGVGTKNAMFCLKSKDFKYIYHVGLPAELYNLIEDPNEKINLINMKDYSKTKEELHAKLLEIIGNPEKIDVEAKKDQKKRVDEAGGYKVVLARGTFDNTPPPGEEAIFFKR